MQNLVESIRLRFLFSLSSPLPVSLYLRAMNRRRKRLVIRWNDRSIGKRNQAKVWCSGYSRWLLLRRMMFSRNVFCGATRPLRPPGILSSLNDPGSWSLRLSGSRPASGYDEHVLFSSPHVQQRQPSFIDHPPSSPLFPSILLLLSTTLHKCTRATMWGCTRSLTECHDPRIVHHCGIGRNITCRRFHIRLELVQTRTTSVPYPLPNTLCYYQTSTDCPVHIRVNPCRVSSHDLQCEPGLRTRHLPKSFDLPRLVPRSEAFTIL